MLRSILAFLLPPVILSPLEAGVRTQDNYARSSKLTLKNLLKKNNHENFKKIYLFVLGPHTPLQGAEDDGRLGGVIPPSSSPAARRMTSSEGGKK
jgi:hypothetical protein